MNTPKHILTRGKLLEAFEAGQEHGHWLIASDQTGSSWDFDTWFADAYPDGVDTLGIVE